MFVPWTDFSPDEQQELQASGLADDQRDRVPVLGVIGHHLKQVQTNVQHVTQMETLALALCEWAETAGGRIPAPATLKVSAREGTYDVRLAIDPPKGAKKKSKA
jgi:hypothetical protein